jgi:hypothetical protein
MFTGGDTNFTDEDVIGSVITDIFKEFSWTNFMDALESAVCISY